MRERILERILEIKQVCVANSRAWLLGLSAVIAVFLIRFFLFDAEFPLITYLNFIVLVIILYQISHFVALAKCALPAMKRLEEFLKSKAEN